MVPEEKLEKQFEEGNFRRDVWCGFRTILLSQLSVCVLIFFVGALVAGLSFHEWDTHVSCESEDGPGGTPEKFHYVAPVDVVGPCFMSFASGMLFLILIEWIFLEPPNVYVTSLYHF